MMEFLGFAQSDAQAMVGVPATISYRDTSGNLRSVQATIRYVTPIGFAATETGTGKLMLFTYSQVVSAAKIQTFDPKNLLLYGGGALVASMIVFGDYLGIGRLWKGRTHGRK